MNFVEEFNAIMRLKITSGEDKDMLLSAVEMAKARVISEIIRQKVLDNESLKKQVIEAKNDIDKMISTLVAEREAIEAKINEGPVLEEPEIVDSSNVSGPVAKAMQEEEQDRVDDNNKVRLQVYEEKVKELEEKKAKLVEAIARLKEISQSFDDKMPEFIKRLCPIKHNPDKLIDPLVDQIKGVLTNGYYNSMSVGDEQGRQEVFNTNSNSGYATRGNSINLEGAKEFLKVIEQEDDIERAARLVEAEKKVKECSKKQEEVQERDNLVGKFKGVDEASFEEIRTLIDATKEDARSILSNSTAIAERSALARFTSRIGSLFGVKGKQERENDVITDRMMKRNEDHRQRLDEDPQYAKAFELFRKAWESFKDDQIGSKEVRGSEILDGSAKYWLKAIPGSVSVKIDDQSFDTFRELIGMTAISDGSDRARNLENYSRTIPEMFFKKLLKDREIVPKEREESFANLEKATMEKNEAENDMTPNARRLYETNHDNVVAWRDRFLSSKDMHARSAILALRALVGISDEEITQRVAGGRVGDVDKIFEINAKSRDGYDAVFKLINKCMKDASQVFDKANKEGKIEDKDEM